MFFVYKKFHLFFTAFGVSGGGHKMQNAAPFHPKQAV